MEKQKVKLTVRLPQENLDFAKQYAAANQLTVTELVNRYLESLKAQQNQDIHPDVRRISGLVPSDIDGSATYHEHLQRKHQ